MINLLFLLKPWETYTADTSIDLTRHHEPKTLMDKVAYWTVKSLRFPTDIFFQVRAHAHNHDPLRARSLFNSADDQFGLRF